LAITLANIHDHPVPDDPKQLSATRCIHPFPSEYLQAILHSPENYSVEIIFLTSWNDRPEKLLRSLSMSEPDGCCLQGSISERF
jgi:hypothetical protein